MVEAIPAAWHDRCEHCGEGFHTHEPRWVEQRRYLVHTRCARWQLWEHPPYLWKLKELRTRYRNADAEERKRVACAGRAIREMQRVWPYDAADHVARVVAAVRNAEARVR